MASTEFDEARDLMRRLVEVADRESGVSLGKFDIQEFFGIEQADVVTATLQWGGARRQSATGKTPLKAVRALIAQTPWAGRLL